MIELAGVGLERHFLGQLKVDDEREIDNTAGIFSLLLSVLIDEPLKETSAPPVSPPENEKEALFIGEIIAGISGTKDGLKEEQIAIAGEVEGVIISDDSPDDERSQESFHSPELGISPSEQRDVFVGETVFLEEGEILGDDGDLFETRLELANEKVKTRISNGSLDLASDLDRPVKLAKVDEGYAQEDAGNFQGDGEREKTKETIKPPHFPSPEVTQEQRGIVRMNLHVSENPYTEPVSPLVEKMISKIQFARSQGKTQLEIQLKPELLGKLKIQLHHQAGRISARFITDNLQAKEILSMELPRLEKALIQQNLQQEPTMVDVFLDYQEPQDTGEQAGTFQRKRQARSANGGGSNDFEIPVSEEIYQMGAINYLV